MSSPIISNIVLIGFMGSGKTTVGAELSAALHRRVIEMDAVIAARSGFSSVAALIDAKGEHYFRDLETALAKELAVQTEVIISTGGGIISRRENMEALRSNSAVVVFLDSDFETLQARVASEQSDGKDRPLFRDGARARELFTMRYPVYKNWATITVDVGADTQPVIARRIIAALPQRVP